MKPHIKKVDGTWRVYNDRMSPSYAIPVVMAKTFSAVVCRYGNYKNLPLWRISNGAEATNG